MMKRIPHQHEAITGNAAELYEEVHKKHAGFYQRIARDIAALDITGEYLEIGSGTGYLAGEVATLKPDVKITGFDLSSEMISMATDYIKKNNLQERVQFLQGDAGDEQQVKMLKQYDLVYSTFSLHHWEEPEKILANIRKAIKDNGTLFVFDFKRVWWMYYIPIKRGDFDAVRASYTSGELKTFLRQAGITNYKHVTCFFVFQSIIARK